MGIVYGKKKSFFSYFIFNCYNKCCFFFTLLIDLIISDYKEKHYVPKDKMHLNYDNFEEYGQKYIDYYIIVNEEEGLLYDYTIEKKYFDYGNEKSVVDRNSLLP